MSINSNPTVYQQNMKNHPGIKIFSFIAGVMDTGDHPLLRYISENCRKNYKFPSGARQLICEKMTWNWKSRVRLPQVNVIYEPYPTHVHIIQLFSTLPPIRPSIFTEKMIFTALPDKKDDAVKKTESHKYIPGRYEYYFLWAWDVNCWSKVANACPIIIDLWISVQCVRILPFTL